MNYTIVLLPRAQSSLSQLWFASPDQDAIMSAVDVMRQRLAVNPFEEGESREEDEDRIAFEPPLQFFFRVSITERLVQIIRVARFGRLK